ncbi:hypothetical protein C8J57DRAFT_1586069 [Mycena rebaudengoi]|nr:hypothetical protein C8J57DRAFT_1586069 [Mycena rebaudengoi]
MPALASGNAAELRANLAAIKAEIIQHKNELCILEKREREVEERLAHVEYPVLALPPEITSRIFVECLQSHGRVIPSPHAAPLFLAQICRHWRDIALSTCELWSSIYVDVESSVPWALFETWFARAKGHPLSLGLFFGIREPTPVLEFVCSVSERLRRLELRVSYDTPHQLPSLNASFPLLRHFTSKHTTQAQIEGVLQGAPTLRELRLLGMSTTPNFPLPSLARLDINPNVPIAEFFVILDRFPRLEHLGCWVDDAIAYTAKPRSFQQPLSLRLGGTDGATVLNYITLPNLRSLDLPDYIDWDIVLAFLSRSRCPLDYLSIDIQHYGDDEDELPRILPAISSVSTLKMVCWPRDVTVLLECLSSSSLVPPLEHLTVESVGSVDYEVLVEMLRRRRNPEHGIKLRSLRLSITGREDLSEVTKWPLGNLVSSELNRLIADGLDLLLICRSFIVGEDKETEYDYWPAEPNGMLFSFRKCAPLTHLSGVEVDREDRFQEIWDSE